MVHGFCVVHYIEHDAGVITFNITVGYKDSSNMKRGKWSVLAKGHVSRVMTCQHNEWVSGSSNNTHKLPLYCCAFQNYNNK